MFSQLRACNVSVVASGVLFDVFVSFLLARKLSGEAWGAQHSWNSQIGCLEMYFGVFGVFCIEMFIFTVVMGFRVIFWIYEHI